MRKLLVFLIVVFLMVVPLAADAEVGTEDTLEWWEVPPEKPTLTYDLFARASMVRGSSPVVGGGLDIGIQTNSFKFLVYGLGDYYLNPLGGVGGAASLEFSVETGITFAWKFMQVWRTRTYIELDVGYFMQFAQIPQNTAAGIFMAHNGVMLRPKVVTDFQIARHYKMSLGIYYQVPILPSYDEYQGLGIMVSIL